MDDATRVRGVSIFAVDSADELQGYLDTDPMFIAGYLTAEVYPWMGLPGDILP